MQFVQNPTLESHVEFMKLALEMAEQALSKNEVPVGAVLVKNGHVVGKGCNDTNRTGCATRHAEFLAIDQALASIDATKADPALFDQSTDHAAAAIEIISQCDLYVTVEPCVMCASALRQLRINRVFYGAANDRFGGCGSVLDINKCPSLDPSYKCFPGFLRKDAIMLLRLFYVQENEKAPVPRSKKVRLLKTNIPPLDLPAFVDTSSKDQFIDAYGHENLWILEKENVLVDC